MNNKHKLAAEDRAHKGIAYTPWVPDDFDFSDEKSTVREQLHRFKMIARYRRWRAEKLRPMRRTNHRRMPRAVRAVSRKPAAKCTGDSDDGPSQASFAIAKDRGVS